MACGCQKRRDTRLGKTGTQAAPSPERAVTAAARTSWVVVPHAGGVGKRFSTLGAAQDYARRTRGVIRPV